MTTVLEHVQRAAGGLVPYIPGMEPGETARNVVLAVVYILLSWLVMFLAPIWMPIYIGTDYNGVTTELSPLPGIERGGGPKSAIATFIYVVVFIIWPWLVPLA